MLSMFICRISAYLSSVKFESFFPQHDHCFILLWEALSCYAHSCSANCTPLSLIFAAMRVSFLIITDSCCFTIWLSWMSSIGVSCYLLMGNSNGAPNLTNGGVCLPRSKIEYFEYLFAQEVSWKLYVWHFAFKTFFFIFELELRYKVKKKLDWERKEFVIGNINYASCGKILFSLLRFNFSGSWPGVQFLKMQWLHGCILRVCYR